MVERTYPLPIPVLGVPVPGKNNPYIVALVPGASIHVEASISPSSSTFLRLNGSPKPKWSLEMALRGFVEAVASRLEEDLRVEVSYRSSLEAPYASLFAATSTAVLEALVEEGGYEMSVDEIVRAAASIDEDAGTDYDYIAGLRLAILAPPSQTFVYRLGEDPIALETKGRIRLELVGEEDVVADYSREYGDALLSVITRLAGLSVVEAVKKQREGGGEEVFWHAARLDNALYYALYGLEPVQECKWTPSLQAGFGLCRAERGVGEPVEIYW